MTDLGRRYVATAAIAVSAVEAVLTVALDRSLASAQAVANGAFVVVGALILVRRPGNGIGPLLIAFGLAFQTLITVGAIGDALFADDPDVRVWFFVAIEAAFPVAAWIMIPMLVLFPHGTIRSNGVRRFIYGTLLLAIATVIPAFLGTPSSVANPDLVLPHPFMDAPAAADARSIYDALLAVDILFTLAAALSLVWRWRRGGAVERRQIGWLAVGGVTYVVVAAVNTVVGQDRYSGEVFLFIDAVGVVLIPIAVGIAIMRYGLYEIDAIVNRSLIFGTLAAFVGGVYVLIVLGVSSIVGDSSLWLSIFATVVVALAFQPVRERVVRWANRLVYGERVTPYEVLQQFSRHSASDPAADVLPRIPELLVAGCGATSAAVWVREADGFRTASVWPPDASDRALPATDRFDDPDSDISQPVVHDGELLGGISLTKPSNEPLAPDDEALVRSLASGLGVALRNRRLTAALRVRVAELEASRERVLVAADEARRSMESDLDRGAQQMLVAVKVMLGPLRVTADGAGATKTATLLSQLEDQAGSAIASIRTFATGVYPPLLEAEGLAVALRQQATTSAVLVDVVAGDIPRSAREVEAAVYFAILEALQNTAKYSGAGRATVTLGVHGGELRFEVADDGAGFDADLAARGAGLSGMADRIDTVGGTLEIDSAPGHGTTVVGRVPAWA